VKHIPASEDFIPAAHEDPANPGVLKRVIATHSDLIPGQIMMVNWSRLPGDSSFQRHYHEDMQEVFVLINGHVQMKIDAESVQMKSGDTVIVEPREIHEMTNLLDSDADYVVFGVSTGHAGQTVVVD